MPTSYWSEKKYGRARRRPRRRRAWRAPPPGPGAARCPSARRAAGPSTGCRWLATSPAAKMPGTLVSRRPSHEHAVLDGQPGRLGELGPRRRAHAHDDRVAGDRRAVLEAHALDAAVALERDHAGLRCAGRRHGRGGGRGRPRRPRARARARAAPPPARRSSRPCPRWRADAATSDPIQPAPDDDEPAAARPGARAARRCRRRSAARGRRRAPRRGRQPARLGAGGQQQPVVGEPLAVLERELAGARVEAGHGRPGAQLDVVLGVEAGRRGRRRSSRSASPRR